MSKVERIAERLFHEGREKAQFEWLRGEDAPDGLPEAYKIQELLIEKRLAADMGPLAGWKIAVTSKPMQELCGIDQPCVGAMLKPDIHPGPKDVSLGDFGRLGLEFELSIRIGTDDDGAGEMNADKAKAISAAVAPAFELIEDRAANYTDFDAFSLVADNAWNGGVVLGKEIDGWRDIDWKTAPVTLNYNDETETANTGEAMGDPFEALAFIGRNLRERGLKFRAGDIVITGSTIKTRYPSAGDRAKYAIDGLGTVEMRVTA